jgi:SAM-dependent methyltransferase
MLARLFRGIRKPAKPSLPEWIEHVLMRDAHLSGFWLREIGDLFEGYPIAADDTVVDVGCGGGASCVFAAVSGADVIAIDIDPAALDAITKRLQDSPARSFRAIQSDANPIPLPDACASRVICQEVMEHVDDPTAFLDELVRIGRPGALYLLSVPDPASEEVFRKIAPASYWTKPNHLRIFDREQFHGLVDDAGLVIEKETVYGFFWTMWWMLFWSDPDADAGGSLAGTPMLAHWINTWGALLATPHGKVLKQSLDQALPKSQLLIARKAA